MSCRSCIPSKEIVCAAAYAASRADRALDPSAVTLRTRPPAVTIAPSRDELGSNAVVCSPPNAVPLRFGEDSFSPHLRAAEGRGIRPTVLRLPGIALDVDTPEDLAAFAALPSPTRARALLAENDMLHVHERADAPIGDHWG